MRFDLSNEPTLNNLYKMSMSWKKLSRLEKSMMLDTIYNNETKNDYRIRKAIQYCETFNLSKDIDSAKSSLKRFDMTAYNSILGSFNTQIVSSNVEDKVSRTFMQLLEYLKEKALSEVIGECNGILVFQNDICLYYVSSNAAFFEIYSRHNGRAGGDYFYQFGNQEFIRMETLINVELCPRVILPIAFLLFKKFVGIETQMVAPNAKRVSIDRKDDVVNKAPFPIQQIDCTWYTEYIREEGFSVRGFWRWQACGERHSAHKWVYIKPFEKSGYHRRAKKVIQAA